MRLAAAIVMVSAIAHADPPIIKPSEVAAKTAAALAAIDPKTPRGTASELFWIDKANVETDAKLLRVELPNRGLRILEERAVSGMIGFTVEATSGARATIAIGPDRGAVIVTWRPASIALPGACVAIPNVQHHVLVHSRGIDQQGESHEGATTWHLDTARLLDVDGDGVLDAFVPVAAKPETCPEEVSYRVFVVRGSCGHEIGTIGPGSLRYDAATVPLAASGFRPITTSAQKSTYGARGIPEMTTTTRRFEVAGGRYKQVDIKSRTGQCHHCAVWHCTKE